MITRRPIKVEIQFFEGDRGEEFVVPSEEDLQTQLDASITRIAEVESEFGEQETGSDKSKQLQSTLQFLNTVKDSITKMIESRPLLAAKSQTEVFYLRKPTGEEWTDGKGAGEKVNEQTGEVRYDDAAVKLEVLPLCVLDADHKQVSPRDVKALPPCIQDYLWERLKSAVMPSADRINFYAASYRVS